MVDYILIRKGERKELIRDVRVIQKESSIPQHKLNNLLDMKKRLEKRKVEFVKIM